MTATSLFHPRQLGLIGGMGWVSSLEYYRLINEGVNRRLGGTNAARLVLYSLNQAEFQTYSDRGDDAAAVELVMKGVRTLEAAGAESLLLCCNGMHKHAPEIQAGTRLPLIHIADQAAKAIRAQGLSKVALLGARFTMELGFYKDRLKAQGIETLIPGEKDRIYIHHTIVNELGLGRFLPQTKAEYQRIIAELHSQGAQGVVLGCTEIPLLIRQEDVSIPAFDTMGIHAAAAVEFALSQT